MRRNTEQMIEKSVNEGYVKMAEGTGKVDCEASLESYRALGYDVRTWYLERGNNYPWVLYTKMKGKRAAKQSKPVVDYSKMTVKELRVLGKSHNIPQYYKKSKQELVESLQLAA